VSDILLATKIHLPPLHGNLVSRPHLIQRLNDGIAKNRRLTLISAPAGYGKSTLLSEWASQVGIPIAWLSLEKAENVPARFWSYFFTALSTIPHLHQAGMGEAISQALQSPKLPPMEALLANLVNDFAKLEGRAILVLDDLHAITESQIHQDMVFLIEHLPRSASGLHLVVASRMDPPWPLARWRVREDLNELRPVDLRFSYEEAVEFLNRVLPLALSSKDIVALQNRTEGWIAGLQMAAVTIQGRIKTQGPEGVSRYIETFTGSNRFILDYLIEEVISQQPEDINEFLYQTSILEQFTASLCDAVLERHDSQAILELVEQANLFLIPLDDERQWYRYHHLFAELLHKRLKETQPEHIIELHQRACNWYAENNFLSEAINHALDAGDIVRVNEFVSGNALAMVEHTELIDVLRHFEEITDHHFLSKPWLCIAYAWVKAYVDPSGGVDRILQQAEQGMIDVESALERQRLIGHLAAIRAYVAWVQGEADRALEFAHHALENLPEDDWETRSNVLHTEGSALEYLDNLPGAVQSYQAAIFAGQRTGRSHQTYFAYTSLAFAYLLQGRLRHAFSLCQQILGLAEQSGQTSSSLPVLSHAYANMSEVQFEWNEIESAIYNARNSVALAEKWKQAETLNFALHCLPKPLGAAGDLETAFSVTQRGLQFAGNASNWFFRMSAYNEIWLNLLKGDITSADRRFQEVEPLVDESLKKGGHFLVTKVSLLEAKGNYPAVLAAVEEVVDGLEQKGKYWTLTNLLPFQAVALQALGREEEALSVIGHCLALTAPEGNVRIYLERGIPMLKLLRIASSRGLETKYIDKLLPAFNLTSPSDAPGASILLKTRSIFQIAALIEPLSEREIQVLRLLDSSLTSEEISRELYVSVTTTRTHIRNIYSKLGVHGRIEALQKSRELGLI
jgi:LuxR family maltose regulon positive regulatory protein